MKRHGAVVFGAALALAAGVAADTLVLRNGRRLEGELVEYRRDRLEWRDARGRLESFDRDDVRRIEFDDGGFREDGSDASSSGRPSGLRQREVDVSAAAGWTRAGIQVRRGQRIYVESRGEIRWGPDRKDGPAGERGSRRNANRPIPNANAAALIGRIGGGDPFFIGDDRGAIRVPDSGELELGVNDDYLQDNSGYFRVIVYY